MAVVLVRKDRPHRVVRHGSPGDTRLRPASTFGRFKRWLHRHRIIGVVSVDPAIKCRGQTMYWRGKYLRDELGAAVHEEVPTVSWSTRVFNPETQSWAESGRHYFADEVPEDETVPEDAEHGTAKRKKLNPAYDPAAPNVSREDRPEWDYVGLLGQLPLRDGEPVNPRWVRLGRLTTGVSEWLVR